MTDKDKLITEARLISPLALAYIGDGIFELMVREWVLSKGNMPVNKLHKQTVSCVCASAQAKAFDLIEGGLSEDELAVYKRGRNVKGNSVPRNGNPAEYRKATGFEALFGYLHLSKQNDRITELFDKIIHEI